MIRTIQIPKNFTTEGEFFPPLLRASFLLLPLVATIRFVVVLSVALLLLLVAALARIMAELASDCMYVALECYVWVECDLCKYYLIPLGS